MGAGAELRYGRELGEGVDRMYQEMERVGLPDPIFVQSTGAVRVTFLTDPLMARMLNLLPPGSERFAEHLTRTGRCTTSQAMELLGMSRPTTLHHLNRLVEQGLLEAVRLSTNDPRGYWRMARGPST